MVTMQAVSQSLAIVATSTGWKLPADHLPQGQHVEVQCFA
jgi:hypothetical protein